MMWTGANLKARLLEPLGQRFLWSSLLFGRVDNGPPRWSQRGLAALHIRIQTLNQLEWRVQKCEGERGDALKARSSQEPAHSGEIMVAEVYVNVKS